MWQDIKNIYHLANAFFANLWYRFPSKKLVVIGITGTDGKTTTTNIVYHILKTAGKNVSMVSTVSAVIAGKTYDTGFHVTTPSSWEIQRFLKQAAETKENPKYMVLEVTSHAIDQNRVWGIDFAIGVLTNVTHEHLDYHKTYENYVKTKMKLLEKSTIGVMNKDDASYQMVSVKGKNQNAKLQGTMQKLVTFGMKEDAEVNPKTFFITTQLLGEYNRYNILAAIAVCKQLGIEDTVIQNAIKTFEAPIGRQEIIYDKNFTVMIDFAHTPNAIQHILKAIKKETKGKIIHVFGSAGKRDATKRPLMGKASALLADVTILTAEDPRDESVKKINNEIIAGINNIQTKLKNNTLVTIPDRQEAITKAITMAKKGDFVIITGKGHEQSMNYGKGEEPWSDQEAVTRALRETRKT